MILIKNKAGLYIIAALLFVYLSRIAAKDALEEMEARQKEKSSYR